MVKKLSEELRAAEPIKLELSPGLAIGLLGTIQLAARHPGFSNGPTAASMMDLAGSLEASLGKNGKVTQIVCAMGWNPKHDAKTL